MLARRFLGCVFVLILLAVAGAVLFFQYGGAVLVRTATPKGSFEQPAAGSGPDYADPANWLARPGSGSSQAEWRPPLPDGSHAPPPILRPRPAVTFYIHPTTYLQTDRWNAPLRPGGQAESNLGLFLKSQASAFNGVSDIWAPRYRQAAFGAFLLTSRDATKALDLAYSDVRAAFDRFLAEVAPDRPLILAGHSQGALHLLRLLAERRDALRGRVVAAYVVGWPVGVRSDLPAVGLPACAAPDQRGCLLSWQSFAEPAATGLVTDAWVGTRGLTGARRERDEMLCVNPLTGTAGAAAPASANLGTLVPDAGLADARLVEGAVAAACDKGFLTISGDIPAMGSFVLPGNNYHVYDYALFWANIRADAERRLAGWGRR